MAGKKPDAGHIGPLWAILGRRHIGKADRTICREVCKALLASKRQSWCADWDAEREFWGVILAHHGSLTSIDAIRPQPRLWRFRDNYDPVAALKVLAAIVAGMFPDAFSDDVHAPLPDQARFQHAFAGIVTLADWLGSDETVFRFPSEGAPSGVERVQWSREQATELMGRRWFNPTRARDAATRLTTDFATLFPKLPVPRPAQTALLEAPLPQRGQVTLLEAETGSGKTEAALIHFLRLFQEGEVDGLYFALPTRAAAVQIHQRITEMISGWLGAAAPPVGLAVPGYLRVDDAEEGKRLPDTHGVLWPDEVIRDRAWAMENTKRYLSGSVMVGTIDQLLMGGLRVRHAPFRSGPMLRLLLCIDEVHASDAYMMALLRNVLDQHTTAGGHTLLMSATLGSLARLRLLGGRVEAHQAPEAPTAAALWDGPRDGPADERTREFPPHTRGWTVLCGLEGAAYQVSPAHAGMDRSGRVRCRSRCGFPRTRGDGPGFSGMRKRQDLFPPHTRGWTRGVGGDLLTPCSVKGEGEGPPHCLTLTCAGAAPSGPLSQSCTLEMFGIPH